MRKARAKKRPLLPDPRFQSQEVTRFVNNLMLHGKKSIAYGIFYDAIDIVKNKVEDGGLDTWTKALENVTPQVEVRSRRVGGASMGMKWLILYAKKRNEKTMAERLAGEIIAAAKEEGAAHKKKEDTHRMAEANKAFSHFRF